MKTLNVKQTILVASVSLLSACAVGPDYTKPDAQIPDKFAAQSSHVQNESTLSQWWEAFNDELLSQLIAKARQNNHDIRKASMALYSARSLYEQSELSLFPQITSHATYTDSYRSMAAMNNKSYAPRGTILYNSGVDVSWEVDLWGRVRRIIESNQALTEQQDFNRNGLLISITAELARNYFELRGLQQQLSVLDNTINSQTQLVDFLEKRVNIGIGLPSDIDRAKSQLENSRSAIPAIKTAIAKNIHRIGVLVGDTPESLINVLSVVKSIPDLPRTITIGNPGELIKHRPDVMAAERQLASDTAKIGVATGDLYPKVTLAGSLSLESSTLSDMTAPGTSTHSFGPRISWAFLNIGTVYTSIKMANFQAESSLENFKQAVNLALEETENAVVSYDQAHEKVKSLNEAVKASQSAMKLAESRHKIGITDASPLLDAELRFYQDQANLAQSETAKLTAMIALYKALGG